MARRKKRNMTSPAVTAPGPGRVVERASTREGETLFGSITPQRALGYLKTAAYGDPAEQDSLFDTMLERDGHLASVYRQRRTALTGKDWELQPADQVGKSPRIDAGLAAKAHEYCLEILAELHGLEQGLAHLAEALGRTTAVAEIIWEQEDGQMRPVAMEAVPFTQLIADQNDASRLRVITGDGDTVGLAIDEQPPGKFLVHAPYTLGGSHFRGGLLRGAVMGWLAKNHGFKWWLMGVDAFGLPMTVAKYMPGTSDETIKQILKAIRDVGGSRGGAFPQGTEIDMLQGKSNGKFPHEDLLKYVDAQYSKEFVGQTLTTEIGETGGARAAASVHDEVRDDLTEDDARNEGATIREQLLIPMVRSHFGEDAEIATPYFRRVIEQERDLLQMGQLISLAVNELGAEIPAGVVEDELGIKLADDVDKAAPLRGRSVGLGAFSRRPTRLQSCKDDGHTLIANRTLTDTVAQRAGSIAQLTAWVDQASLASQSHAREVQAAIESQADRSETPQALLAALPGMLTALPIGDLVELETHLLLAGQLAGRAGVHEMRRANSRGGRLIANAARIGFAAIPFTEAVDALRDRLGLDPDTFEELEAEARSRAWRVAGVWNMQMLSDIHRELVASIEAGETSRGFRLRVPEMLDRRGWVGETPWHADLVQFQNFVMSHAAGRYRQYQEFGVNAWRFVQSGDSCPICEALIGKTFSMSDRRYFPPVHFGCDCEEEPVFDSELEPGQIEDSGDVENPGFDEEQTRPSGFKWDPAQYANLEPVRLGAFPEDLQAAFAAFAQEHGWEVVR